MNTLDKAARQIKTPETSPKTSPRTTPRDKGTTNLQGRQVRQNKSLSHPNESNIIFPKAPSLPKEVRFGVDDNDTFVGDILAVEEAWKAFSEGPSAPQNSSGIATQGRVLKRTVGVMTNKPGFSLNIKNGESKKSEPAEMNSIKVEGKSGDSPELIPSPKKCISARDSRHKTSADKSLHHNRAESRKSESPPNRSAIRIHKDEPLIRQLHSLPCTLDSKEVLQVTDRVRKTPVQHLRAHLTDHEIYEVSLYSINPEDKFKSPNPFHGAEYVDDHEGTNAFLSQTRKEFSVDDKNLSVKAIEGIVEEFIFKALKNLFFTNKISYKKFHDYDSLIANDLIYAIKNNGLLLKPSLARLSSMRNKLIHPVVFTSQKTKFSEKLYEILSKLLEIKRLKFKSESGKRNKTAEDLNEFFKNSAEIHPIIKKKNESRYITGDVKNRIEGLYKLSTGASSGSEYEASQLMDLLYILIGGCVDEGKRVIEYFKEWEENPQLIFNKVISYSREVALLCYKGPRILQNFFHCQIDDSYLNPQLGNESPVQPSLSPRSGVIEVASSKMNKSMAMEATRVIPQKIEAFSDFKYDCQGRQVFINSYSTTLTQLVRALVPDDEFKLAKKEIGVLLKEIYVNGSIIYPLTSNSNPLSDRAAFFTHIFYHFLKQGFAEKEVRDCYSEAKLQTNNFFKFLHNPELLNEKDASGDVQDIMKLIPCLKIAELMIVNCLQVGIQYIDSLFPDLREGNVPSKEASHSYFSTSHAIGAVKCYVKIDSPNDFKVTQKTHFNIYHHNAHSEKEHVATIYYSWENKPKTRPDSDRLPTQKWHAHLNIYHYDIHNDIYWKRIMEILTDPKDLRSNYGPNPPGLSFSREVIKNKELRVRRVLEEMELNEGKKGNSSKILSKTDGSQERRKSSSTKPMSKTSD